VVHNIAVVEKVIDLGWRVYRSVYNSYAPVLPLLAIPYCTLCTSTSDDRLFFCAAAGRPARDFRNWHLDARDDVCAAAYMADAACTKAPTHSAAISNAPPRSATRANRLSVARTTARIAAPAFRIAPARTAAVTITPPRTVTRWTIISSAYIAARTPAASYTDRPAANPCTVGARRRVRCCHHSVWGRNVRKVVGCKRADIHVGPRHRAATQSDLSNDVGRGARGGTDGRRHRLQPARHQPMRGRHSPTRPLYSKGLCIW